MAAWAGARKGDGHGPWPSCATAGAQGQAEAAKVTVICVQTGGRIQPVTALRASSPAGTFGLLAFTAHGFLLAVAGNTVPVKLGTVLAAPLC